jgi:Undecaprenyl-phosphate glucose phosphotransferase
MNTQTQYAVNMREWLPTFYRNFTKSTIASLIAFSDTIIILGTGLAVYFFYVGWSSDTFPAYLAALTMNIILTIGAFYFSKLYVLEPIPHPVKQAKKILRVCGVIFLLLLLTAFSLKISDEFSRVWVYSTLLISVPLLCLSRAGYYNLFHKWARSGSLAKHIAIIGGGEQAARLVEKFEAQEYPWLRIVGVFDDRSDRIPSKIGNYDVLGNLDDLINYVQQKGCDDILIALPWTAEQRILKVLDKLKVLPINVSLAPDLIGSNFTRGRFENYGGIPVLNIVAKPIIGWGYFVKILEDRILALCFLTVISPVLLLIALLIKLDSPGPVFFRQKRYGFNNRLIEVYKFRTMYIDQQDNDAAKLTSKNDPRVTPIGNFLRSTSLDELPQFINVLKGEMSIVGPRPHALKASAAGKLYQDAVSEYAVRHKVKPGITGWAQINGWRGETDTIEKIAKRIEHDIYYINNWSLMLDLWIILKTPFVCIGKDNVY